MPIIANKTLLVLFMDEQNRSYYVEGGIVKKRNLMRWLNTNPVNENEIVLQFGTNERYFSMIRGFSNAITYADDGRKILVDRHMKGKGTEEIMYQVIMKQDPSGGINYYRMVYKARIDFSKFNGNLTEALASINTLQDDVFAIIQANESNTFPIQCNSSNPAAIKVLFDGIPLQDKVNYNTLAVGIAQTSAANWLTIPLAQINNEGDSVGAVFQSQNYDATADPDTYVRTNSNNCLYFTEKTTVTIKGDFVFAWHKVHGDPTHFPGTDITFLTSQSVIGTSPVSKIYRVFHDPTGSIISASPLITIPINISITLDPLEKLFFFANINGAGSDQPTIVPEPTNISILFSTKQVPSTHYALRPLDYWQQLVSQITNGKYTGDSNFFRNNNRKVILSGSSLRSFPDAVILDSPANCFKAYDVPYWMGYVVRNGVLFIEPIEDIYNNKNQLWDFGEVSKASYSPATSYIYTAVDVGYTKQTYNKRNGRYDYNNGKHSYKLPVQTVLNKLDLVSPWRNDPFGMEFIRTGYANLNTTDDKGDTDVFQVMISDVVGQTNGEVSNAVTFSIETLILVAPMIKSPYSGSTVYNSQPTITGISQPAKNINVYVDGQIDGSTVSDANGFFTYQIQNVLRSRDLYFNGVHTIEANAQTDPANISGFSKMLSLIVDTTITAPFLITSPTNNDTLYNNLPIITGTGQANRSVTVKVDGASKGTVVINSSGIWALALAAPLADGARVITASIPGLPDAPTINITVNKNVTTPLITSLAYGDIIYNNLPLIKGVATAGATVTLWIDAGGGIFVSGVPTALGTTVADANGDWQFQVTEMYDSSNIQTFYIPDGLHVIATTQVPIEVLAAVSGYRLMRGTNKGPTMDYDAIRLNDLFIPTGIDPATLPPTLGDFLQTQWLYNIEETTPLECLRRHLPQIAGGITNQPNEAIVYKGTDGANPNLVRKKNGVISNEGQDIQVKDFPKSVFLPWILNFTAISKLAFNDILINANAGGYIPLTVKGIQLFVLPVGKMQMNLVSDDTQNFQLLVSSQTPLINFIQAFEKGLTIQIGKNMVHFSDYNPIMMVAYNYTPDPKYNFVDIYDDWQSNRYPDYIEQPDYKQPWQKAVPIPFQAVTNGVGVFQLHLIRCSDAAVVHVFAFAPVIPSVVSIPNILQQCMCDCSGFPDDIYWIASFTDGVYTSISEKINLKTKHKKVIYIEYDGNQDKVDYYFSTGIKPGIFVEGSLSRPKFSSELTGSRNDAGESKITRAVATRSRIMTLGNDEQLISDGMANKINDITGLAIWYADSYQHTRNPSSELEEKDNPAPGFPNVLYTMEVELAKNATGRAFTTPGDTSLLKHSTWYTLDATAIDLNGNVQNIQADETP